MITILYNKDDFEAASIALKAQSLAQNSSKAKIYIVPKHYGRVQSVVYANLKKTKVALFISHDVSTIDAEAKSELRVLSDLGVAIHFIVPTTFSKGLISEFANATIHQYHGSNKAELIKDLGATIKKLEPISTKSKSKQSDVPLTFLLIGLVVLLLGLASNSGRSR